MLNQTKQQDQCDKEMIICPAFSTTFSIVNLGFHLLQKLKLSKVANNISTKFNASAKETF